jgi:RHS repeat-associated protein
VVTPAVDNDTYFCWSYDAFGNRLQQMGSGDAITGGGGSACQGESGASVEQASYSAANNNQLSATTQGSVQYDDAGDVTNDGVYTYLYNANGQICAVEGSYQGMTVMYGYIYDADGERVAKGTITNFTSCDPSVNGFTTTSDYVRDQSGNQMSEFTLSGGNPVLVHTNVYANGALFATYDTQEVHFYLNDWLGTRRVQTDSAGMVEQDCASLPYGDSETCTPLPTENLYTGKERDQESGNDYFGARYYSSMYGRWLSPDWSAKAEPVPYAKLGDPQSLNLYTYVQNNPLTRFDPDGHIDCSGKNAAGVGCQFLAKWDAARGIASNVLQQVMRAGYFQKEGGVGIGDKVKLGKVNIDVDLKRTNVDRKEYGKKATRTDTIEAGAKVVIPTKKFGDIEIGLAATRTKLTMVGDQEEDGKPSWDFVPLVKWGTTSSTSSDIGIGDSICFILCGGYEVGVQASKLDGSGTTNSSQ